jgi:hypothetical protein
MLTRYRDLLEISHPIGSNSHQYANAGSTLLSLHATRSLSDIWKLPKITDGRE